MVLKFSAIKKKRKVFFETQPIVRRIYLHQPRTADRPTKPSRRVKLFFRVRAGSRLLSQARALSKL